MYLSFGKVLFHVGLGGAENADGQAGSRKRVPLGQLVGDLEVFAQPPHLVLVELGERLNNLALCPELSHQICIVVMGLDQVGLLL